MPFPAEPLQVWMADESNQVQPLSDTSLYWRGYDTDQWFRHSHASVVNGNKYYSKKYYRKKYKMYNIRWEYN